MTWLLEFNIDKCHVLTLGKFENIKHTHRYTIFKNDVFREKDLGVTFESDLKFEDHISAKVNKANAIAGLIRRSFSFPDGRLFKKLYMTFVQPAIWSMPNQYGPLT